MSTPPSSGSPRPTFNCPTPIPFEKVTHFIWGDDKAGRVEDWIYVSSEDIHQLMFGMSPGTWFRHSPDNRTVFGADEIYIVLSGILWLSNPETGEMHRVAPGEAAFFRKDTWHHGLAEGPDPLRVLEYFSPPPRKGTSQAYARTRPYLDKPIYVQDQWLSRWPAALPEARKQDTMKWLGGREILWRGEGSTGDTLVGLWCSTEHLTAGILRLLPRTESELRRHGGDVCFHGKTGRLEIVAEGGETAVIARDDGYFIPGGVSYRVRNVSAETSEAYFGVGGAYQWAAR